MDNKVNIQKTFKEIEELLIETNDIEKTIELFFNKEIKDLEGIVDFSELKKLMITQAKASKTLHSIYEEDDDENILENTLKQFDYEFENEQKEIFKELIKYDKAIIYDENKVFYRLNHLILKIFEHIDTLSILNNLENEEDIIKRGIAKTPHPIVKDAITPRVKTIKDYHQLNDSKESKLMKNLYTSFSENPLETRAMYQGINTPYQANFIGEEKELVNTIFNQEKYLNSATKLDDVHIFKSCQIYSYSFYKENTLVDSALQLKKHIPYRTLSKYINTLMNSFFDYEFESKLNTTHISKEVQMRDNFNNLEILEYRTQRNKKEHPIFEDI